MSKTTSLKRSGIGLQPDGSIDIAGQRFGGETAFFRFKIAPNIYFTKSPGKGEPLNTIKNGKLVESHRFEATRWVINTIPEKSNTPRSALKTSKHAIDTLIALVLYLWRFSSEACWIPYRVETSFLRDSLKLNLDGSFEVCVKKRGRKNQWETFYMVDRVTRLPVVAHGLTGNWEVSRVGTSEVLLRETTKDSRYSFQFEEERWLRLVERKPYFPFKVMVAGGTLLPTGEIRFQKGAHSQLLSRTRPFLLFSIKR